MQLAAGAYNIKTDDFIILSIEISFGRLCDPDTDARCHKLEISLRVMRSSTEYFRSDLIPCRLLVRRTLGLPDVSENLTRFLTYNCGVLKLNLKV
ncbi:hypothetical protein ABKN59_009081 [Abortiporus biennis]